MWSIGLLFIIGAISMIIWILIFIRRLSTSDRPLPYICYILASSGYCLSFLTEDPANQDSSWLGIFIIWGIIATAGLISLIFDSKSVYRVLELRDAEIQTRHKIILGGAAIFGSLLPWGLVFGIFDT